MSNSPPASPDLETLPAEALAFEDRSLEGRSLEDLSPEDLRQTLEYLADLGYRDLYLRPGAEAAAPAAPQLLDLAQEAASCQRCRLAKGRQKVVFGCGSPSADLMFVGEGPGAQEDRQGEPFVGPAGQLLTKIIEAIGRRREDVYIANVVKCRPPQNRDPEADEVEACRSYLEQQIALVQPRALVALGRVAAQTLLGTGESLGRLRGRWHRFLGVPLRVTYHPAALLRFNEYKRPTWDDMRQVQAFLAEP